MNLNDAVNQNSSDAGDAFDRAHTEFNRWVTGPQNETDEQKKQRLTKLNQARTDLGTALAQLIQAATMTSDQKGRDGYADVVKLMKSTADAAQLVCARVGTLATNTAGSTTDIQLLNALSTALASLAQLSPARVWQKTPSSNG
jgi:hypothetical protein